MPGLSEHTIHCPYCDESISVLIDGTLDRQNYVEDCQVCCRPIELEVSIEPDGAMTVLARTDSE